MKINRHEVGKNGTIIYIETDDGLIGHAIPNGILEQRIEAWDLPDDVDPLDVVFAESYFAQEEMPESPFDGDWAANRDKVLSIVRERRGGMKGDRSAVSAACRLPAADADRLRKRLRVEFAILRGQPDQVAPPIHQALANAQSGLKDIRLGYERRAEEQLAADMVADLPEGVRGQNRTREGSIDSGIKYVP